MLLTNKKLHKTNNISDSFYRHCHSSLETERSWAEKLIEKNLEINREIIALRKLFVDNYTNCDETLIIAFGILQNLQSELNVVMTLGRKTRGELSFHPKNPHIVFETPETKIVDSCIDLADSCGCFDNTKINLKSALDIKFDKNHSKLTFN